MFTRYINLITLSSLLIVRYSIFILTLVFAYVYIPFSSDFTYLSIPEAEHLSRWVSLWANFDGEHYLHIAREGYHDIDRAFFPLFPHIIRFLHQVTGINSLIIGFVFNQIIFCISICVLLHLLKKFFKVKKPMLFILFMLLYPTSFYYSAVYTESLFLFCTLLSLLFLYENKVILFSIMAICTSLTRIQGAFILIPAFFSFYIFGDSFISNIKRIVRSHLYICAPLIGLAVYMFYLYKVTGNPLYFLTAQSSFGANRSSSIILLPQVYYRYFRIFTISSYNYQYFIAVIEFLMFNFCLILSIVHGYVSYKEKNKYGLGIALFSLVNLLLPTLTGTLSSTPRYTLFALSPYFLMIRWKPWVQYVVGTIFILVQVILLAFFAQGHFVS